MEEKLGLCILCGARVKNNHSYITAKEGYAHSHCLRNTFTGMTPTNA